MVRCSSSSSLAIVFLFCVLARSATAALGAEFIQVDVPGADSSTDVRCINNFNDVAGEYQDSNFIFHGFFRKSDGTITSFEGPGAKQTLPFGMNDKGDVVGTFVVTVVGVGTFSHGFARFSDGSFLVIDPPGAKNTVVTAINNKGEIVGYYMDNATPALHAFLREPDGTFVYFRPSKATEPMAINKGGTIVGKYFLDKYRSRGFIRSRDGHVVTFTAPMPQDYRRRGEIYSRRYIQPVSINAGGVVAANYVGPDSRGHAFLRDPNGQITAINVPNSFGTVAEGLNSRNYVVGVYEYTSGDKPRGFLRTPEGRFITLSGPNGEDLFPTGINRARTIVGSYQDANGEHGFIMLRPHM